MSISEYQLLNKVLDVKDYSIIQDNLISNEHFSQAKNEFEFIKSFYAAYKSIPDKETFIAKFPEFEIFRVSESTVSIIDALREECLFRKAVEIINKSSELFSEDANAGAQYLLNNVKSLEPNYSFSQKDIIHDTSRYDEWKDRLNNKDGYFIPSGFPELDEYTFGWKRCEEFALMTGRAGKGKSALAVKSAQHAWSLGFNVAFFSPEISANTLGYRFDSANNSYSNTALLRGDLVPEYDKYIEKLQTNKNKFLVTELGDFNNEVTVPKLKYWCKYNGADILFIDGFDYLSDTRAQKFHSREDRLGHIAQDLVILSIELKIPVVGVIQTNRKGADNDTEIGTEHITGADKIGASCTRLISLKALGPAIELYISKNRYGRDKVKVLYQWDADRSKFFPIQQLDSADEQAVKDIQETKEQFKYVF